MIRNHIVTVLDLEIKSGAEGSDRISIISARRIPEQVTDDPFSIGIKYVKYRANLAPLP
jgi:hypothetical protein